MRHASPAANVGGWIEARRNVLRERDSASSGPGCQLAVPIQKFRYNNVVAMASALSAPPITIEQYLTFESPEGYRDELINGKIIVSPEAKPLHFDIAENLYELLKATSNT